MQNYDVIIIGAGIAGFGVGGILQNYGLKTVILEKSSIPGGRCKTFDVPGGWKVDSGTHCVDLGEFSPCADLLKKLGKEIPWSRPVSGFMIYDSGKWTPMVDYLGMTDDDKKELAEFETWMQTISEEETGAFDDLSLARLIRDKHISFRLAEFLNTVGMVQTTLSDSNLISAGEFISIYRETLRYHSNSANPFSQVRMPLGGIVTMINAFQDAYLEKGGTLCLRTPVRKVRITGKDMIEVLTDNETLRASNVVMAVPIWQMLNILSMDEMAELAPDWTSRMHGLETETSASMGFTLGTRAPLFAEPCYLSAWRLDGVDLPLQILLHTNFDDTIAPKDHTIAFMGVCCTPEDARNKMFRDKTLPALWEVIKEIFPTIESDLLWRKEAYFVGIDGLARSPGMTGDFRPPVSLPQVPGLFFAGDCYTGRGIGMNAAANSAMICSREITAKFDCTCSIGSE